MTHDIIVASLGGASTVFSGLYLRHIRKRDDREKYLQAQIDEGRRCCEDNARTIERIIGHLERFADYGLPRYFDKD